MLPGTMAGYTTQEVAEVLGISESQVRAFVRSGLIEPGRGPGNAYRYTFQDIVLLRTARELRERDVPARRINRALRTLQEMLPVGRPLSAVNVSAQGHDVVVRERDSVWEPETGQMAFDFSVGELAAKVEPFAGPMARERAEAEGMEADDWYDLGWDLEAVSVGEAMEAYRRALELDPEHSETRVNLGRLLHEAGRVEGAEAEYRKALDAAPGSALAAFNLGVALEDRGEEREAVRAYERALELDPELSSAHFNLARLCERRGDSRAALRHLSAYRRLSEATPA